MASAAVHDVLLPRPPGGLGAGALLALLAHGLLLLALMAGVDWRSRTPPSTTASAELWAAMPLAAAPAVPQAQPTPPPPAVTPPAPVQRTEPPPPPADIGRERAARDAAAERKKLDEIDKRKDAAKKKIEADAAKSKDSAKANEMAKTKARTLAEAEAKAKAIAKAKAETEAAADAKAEEAVRVAQRAENLKRLLGEADAATSRTVTSTSAANPNANAVGTATADAGPSAAYTGKLVAAIRINIVYTGSVGDNTAAEVEVRTGPAGSILSRRLLKSSGNAEWDAAVLRAIDRTATLPRDTDGRVPAALLIVFRPRE